jgi:hypothetical protein
LGAVTGFPQSGQLFCLPRGSPLGWIDLASSAFFSSPSGPLGRQVLANLLSSLGRHDRVLGDEAQGKRIIEDSHGACDSTA